MCFESELTILSVFKFFHHILLPTYHVFIIMMVDLRWPLRLSVVIAMLANQIIASCNAESSRLHLKYILRNQHIHKFIPIFWLKLVIFCCHRNHCQNSDKIISLVL